MRLFKRSLVWFSLSAPAWGAATNPTAPTTFTVSRPAVTGATVTVASGDNLQTKYNSASCGDVLVVEAEATFTGNFIFTKQCTDGNWLQIVSSSLAGIPVPVHGSAAEANSNAPATAPNTALYPLIRSTNGAPPIVLTDSGVPAKYHYFAGLEVSSTVSQTYLIGVSDLAETTASQLADRIYFDRVYAHGVAASGSVQMVRAFLLGGSYVAVVNSYVSDIYSNSD